MGKIYIETDQSVPRYVCTDCSNCSSLIGKSLCKVKNRGCCWYFPKFSLVDIQRMTKSPEGLRALSRVIDNPNTKIYNYYMQARGFFDEAEYNKYIESGKQRDTGYIEDHTIFFRACPFVKAGKGCTLPPRFRTFVCNFFICKEITDAAKHYELFKSYEDERIKYSRWLDWENEGLRHVLAEHNLTLHGNLAEAVQILQKLEISQYEFPQLEPIILGDSWYKGA